MLEEAILGLQELQVTSDAVFGDMTMLFDNSALSCNCTSGGNSCQSIKCTGM